MRKRTDGFTLVELMVVILVVGILVAVAVPVFRAARNTAEKNTCQANQRTWAGVVQQAKANDDEPTSTEGLKMLSTEGGSAWYGVANTYLKTVPVCPTSKTAYWVYEDVRGTPANGNLYGCAAASAEWTGGHGLVDQVPSGDVIVWKGLVYKVITAEDGRQWLDRNLGATTVDPSKEGSFGWYYQWGRSTDGHQVLASPTEAGPTDSPSSNFITVASGSDWRANPDAGLWSKAGGPNNPCPQGFHVPDRYEWDIWFDAARSSYGDGALNCARLSASLLHLPVAGVRDNRGERWDPGKTYYWSSTKDIALFALPSEARSGYQIYSSWGCPIRAIKN